MLVIREIYSRYRAVLPPSPQKRMSRRKPTHRKQQQWTIYPLQAVFLQASRIPSIPATIPNAPTDPSPKIPSSTLQCTVIGAYAALTPTSLHHLAFSSRSAIFSSFSPLSSIAPSTCGFLFLRSKNSLRCATSLLWWLRIHSRPKRAHSRPTCAIQARLLQSHHLALVCADTPRRIPLSPRKATFSRAW